jgi:uroporphyrinogen III methyltransferase/synthase
VSGCVYLIGAGPGDPGLITVRGLECLRRADVVVYDALAPEALLSEAPPSAERIYVGKKSGAHTLPQERINALLVEKARAGRVVARLKGGDPFVFGRGGEEADALRRAGVAFEVVPGITAGIAAPAYAGIPVTHRGLASTLTFVTGHEEGERAESAIDWSALAGLGGTLVFYMGVRSLPAIVERLRAGGREAATPVALIRWGTTERQEVRTGTLGTILEAAQGIEPPAIAVIGEVAALRPALAWFEKRPLFGRRVLVTRAREQASDLIHLLTERGAAALEFPVIRIEPPSDPAPIEKAIADLPRFDWIVFTSANAADRFFERLEAAGRDPRALGEARLAAIGPKTAERLRALRLRVDSVPGASFRAEAVARALVEAGVAGRRVLLPRAEVARDVLPEELRRAGAEVVVAPCYRTVMDGSGADRIRTALTRGEVDAVTFTSSSTVTNFVEALGAEFAVRLPWGPRLAAASIGPITSETARAVGIPVAVEAERYTIEGLVEALSAHVTADRAAPKAAEEEHGIPG